MTLSAEEMPPEIFSLWEPLYQDVCTLHWDWLVFCQLYADKENVELLNKAAPGFFGGIQNILWHNVLLGICRLTDKKRVAGRETSSLEQLAERVDRNQFAELFIDLESLHEQARIAAEPARYERNKRISHADLHVRLKTAVKVEQDVTFTNTEEALAGIRKFMNKIEEQFRGGRVMYEELITNDNAQNLIRRLKIADASGLTWRDLLKQSQTKS